jgi:Na+/H+ antiporter NhaD/arsenite permease-like protein
MTYFAIAVFVAAYACIISERFSNTKVALVGAGLMITLPVIESHDVFYSQASGIDWDVIFLMLGMMIIVSILRHTGIFEYVAIWAVKRANGSPLRIMILLILIMALASAVLPNVVSVLLIAPVTLLVCERLAFNPIPLLMAEVFASNIGGTATLIGDPPNILIGSLVGLDFNAFVIHLTPIIIVVMAVQALMIHLLWGKAMKSTPEHRARVMAMHARDMILDPVLLKQALVVLAVVILAFIFSRQLHAAPATIAMSGAAILMFLDNWQHHNEKQSENVHKTFGDVEWITIFFFIGLFIVVRGVEVGGLLKLLADKLVVATGGSMATAGYAILWASAVLSAIIDNIPFVATMIPLIKNMAPAYGGADRILPLWWCLSLGACLGGNGTLIGASANLTVAGLAERNGIPFRFLTYTYYAFPMMLISVAICHIYVWWRYF